MLRVMHHHSPSLASHSQIGISFERMPLGKEFHECALKTNRNRLWKKCVLVMPGIRGDIRNFCPSVIAETPQAPAGSNLVLMKISGIGGALDEFDRDLVGGTHIGDADACVRAADLVDIGW